MKAIEAEEFVIRPTAADDLPLLLTWHSDPDVHRFWQRRPLSEEEITHKYLGGRLPSVRCFIIECPRGQPVGFVEHADLEEPGHVGIDMFLVPGARGMELGPRVASQLARHLLANGAARVTVDPLLSNPRAIRAWEKAGFKQQSAIESGDHGEPAILMAFPSP